MENDDRIYSFSDRNQSYWQIASILSASIGIPGAFVGGNIAIKYGIGSAISSVLIGNLILWIIGLSIISMTASRRDNALENVQQFLGKFGALFASLSLIVSFLSWYILQINAATMAFSKLIPLGVNWLRIGAAFGGITALISYGGIHLIKRICPPFLLILFVFCFYFIAIKLKYLNLNYSVNISLGGVITIISVNLPGFVNLPTFFRHSRSKGDSFLALSLIILFTIFFQIFTIITGLNDPGRISIDNMFYSICTIILIATSLICANLINIYFASAGWEMIFPHHKSNKEFIIIGLLGTLAYTFFQITAPMQFILDSAENVITSLGIVLLLAFFTKTFERHRPNDLGKIINLSCWVFGAMAGIVYISMGNIGSPKTLVISFCATLLAFLFIIYIEETYWSAKKLLLERKK